MLPLNSDCRPPKKLPTIEREPHGDSATIPRFRVTVWAGSANAPVDHRSLHHVSSGTARCGRGASVDRAAHRWAVVSARDHASPDSDIPYRVARTGSSTRICLPSGPATIALRKSHAGRPKRCNQRVEIVRLEHQPVPSARPGEPSRPRGRAKPSLPGPESHNVRSPRPTMANGGPSSLDQLET